MLRTFPHTVLAASLTSIATLIAGLVAYGQTHEVERLRLQSEVNDHANRISNHLSARETLVTAIAAAYEPDDPKAPFALRRVDARILNEVPDAFSFVWIARGAPEDAPRLLDALKRAGVAAPYLMTARRAPLDLAAVDRPLAIVLDVQPATPVNLRSLGLDILSLPAPRAAIEQADRTRRAAATAPIELVQLPGVRAVVLYAPVHRALSPAPEPVAYVGMSFRYDHLLAAAGEPIADGLGFTVFDPGDPNPAPLIAQGTRSPEAGRIARTVPFAGRSLVVEYSPARQPRDAALIAAVIAAGAALLIGAFATASTAWLSRVTRRIDAALEAKSAAEGRLKVLNRELNHRVRNLLGVVVSLTRLSLRGSGVAPEVQTAVLDRLRALGATTTLLADADWSGIGLRQAIDTAIVRQGPEIEIEGPDVILDPSAAQYVTLMAHELWTNACKHGAFAREGGKVRLSWTEAEGTLRLSWTEEATGGIAKPTRQGFGRQLIESIVPQALGGRATLQFTPDGLRYDLAAPMGHMTPRPSAGDLTPP